MKRTRFFQPLVKALALVLCVCLLAPVGAAAEEGAAPTRALEQAASTTERPAADPAQELSADELADLSVRAEEPGPDVVGGALTNTQLTYIVIALAAAVIVLIAK